MLQSFVKDFARSFYSPISLYREISLGRRSVSWLCVLIYCLVYVVGSFWLYFKGFTPFVEPWLQLPEDRYYLIQSFYIIPLVFLMWILATGVLRVLSKQLGGKGDFNTLFNMTGYSLWAPWYPLIIVDIIHATPEWLYNTVLGACIILIIIGTAAAVKVEEKIKAVPAFAASIISFASIGLILFTYIR